MFLAKMNDDLKLVRVHGANSKRLRLELNLKQLGILNQHMLLYASGKHLCKSNLYAAAKSKNCQASSTLNK